MEIFFFQGRRGFIRKAFFFFILSCVFLPYAMNLNFHALGAAMAFGQSKTEVSAFLEPDTVTAGEIYSWKVTIIPEAGGIKEGGSMKVQFPNSMAGFSAWMYKSQGPYIFKNHQTINPGGWDYVGATCSRQDVSLHTEVSTADIDDRGGYAYRSSRVFTVRVTRGAIMPGDSLFIHYANTSAPVIRETNFVRIAIDAAGNGRYLRIANEPTLTTLSREPEEIHIIGPSQAMVGEPATYTIRVLDKHGNRADNFRARFFIESSGRNAVIPDTLEIYPFHHGILRFTAVFKDNGIQRLTLTDNRHIAHTGIESNPVLVMNDKERENIYWGDIHSHSDFSNASIGVPETAFDYAKNVARLDFYSLTLQRTWREQPREEQFEIARALVHTYYRPGEFVTFTGMEWQGHGGDHNTIFLNENVQIPYTILFPTYREYMKHLSDNSIEAITIPHHTGIRWNGYYPGYREDFEGLRVEGGDSALFNLGTKTDWSIRSPFRTVGEIYSLHGSSEYYGASNIYDDVDNTMASAVPTPHYLRNAWEQGHIMGVVASGDDHFARPGRIYAGAAAVYAPELTREAIFTAIKDRRTYGTTGHRILLNFSINGHPMGSVFAIGEDSSPNLHIAASAMEEIEKLEIFKYDGFQWSTIFESRPKAKDFEASFTDYGYVTSSLYYVRLMQKEMYQPEVEIRPRKVMAWSSPVWVKKRGKAWWDKN